MYHIYPLKHPVRLRNKRPVRLRKVKMGAFSRNGHIPDELSGTVPLVLKNGSVVSAEVLRMQYRHSKLACRLEMPCKLSPIKQICVFEHSVMTNFNCACPAI